MPVRITPRGSFLISYDSVSKSWVTLEGSPCCILNHYVDVEPGTTLANLFDIVERDKDLKRFLSEYCSCDIDALHRKHRHRSMGIEVPGDIDDDMRITNMVEATNLVVTPFWYVYTDEAIGERCLSENLVLMAASKENPDVSVTLGHEWGNIFGALCGLELTLNRSLNINECDEDKLGEDGYDTAFSAQIQYTLLDVFKVVYDFFGKPEFDARYQRQVDEEEELIRRFHERRTQENKDDDGAESADDADTAE